MSAENVQDAEPDPKPRATQDRGPEGREDDSARAPGHPPAGAYPVPFSAASSDTDYSSFADGTLELTDRAADTLVAEEMATSPA